MEVISNLFIPRIFDFIYDLWLRTIQDVKQPSFLWTTASIANCISRKQAVLGKGAREKPTDIDIGVDLVYYDNHLGLTYFPTCRQTSCISQALCWRHLCDTLLVDASCFCHPMADSRMANVWRIRCCYEIRTILIWLLGPLQRIPSHINGFQCFDLLCFMDC